MGGSDSAFGKRSTRARLLALAAITLATTSASVVAMATAVAADAPFPSKPINLVVPYPPGGSNDVFARAMSRRLTASLKVAVVVENRPGGGGTIGENYVSHSAPDGYTLIYVSSSYTTNAAVDPHLPFDPIKGLTAIAITGKGPFIILVSPNFAGKNLADFIATAKKSPGKLNYATSGLGSVNQFATEQFAKQTGIKLTHIPYKGMGPAVNDLVGGHVDVIFGSIPSLMQIARSGKVRALAVTSDGQSPLVPELPSANQNGAPGFVFDAWSGILAPGGTPPAIVNKLNAEINRILNDKEMQTFLHNEGIVESPSTPAQFGKIISDDIRRWKSLAQEVGIKIE
jgi:tripartite-type tricarboxylate transporter receptor subunit TctC